MTTKAQKKALKKEVLKKEMRASRIVSIINTLESVATDVEDAMIELQQYRSLCDEQDENYDYDKDEYYKEVERRAVREAERFVEMFTSEYFDELRSIYYDIKNSIDYISFDEKMLKKFNIL